MCSNEGDDLIKKDMQCPRMPWVIRLGDQFLPQHQLGAAYQATNIDHKMRLNINSDIKPARLTGIMITLGINNSHPTGVMDAVTAGADIVRLNMSHKDQKWHAISVQSIRQAGNKMQRIEGQISPLGVAIDLQGPKILTGLFKGDSKSMGFAVLKEGENVKLFTDDSLKRVGTSSAFWISYSNLQKICQSRDKIWINHGAVVLEVISSKEKYVMCKIIKGGTVKEESIVELCHSILDLPQISEKDDQDIDLASELECDFLISSHTRNGKMLCAIKDRVKQIGKHSMYILAKISTQQGLESFDDILKVADGIVFDRESLAFEIGLNKLFLAQKFVIAKCNRIGKPVVVRFEFCCNNENLKMNMGEIANAVLEGADTIYLATGLLHAKETADLIQKVDIVCREAESARWQRQLFEELSYKALIPLDPTHSVAIATVEMSMKCNAAAIIVTTTTGRSAMMLSIYRPRCPIVAISRHGIPSRLLQIYFGVHPIHYRNTPHRDWNKDMDARIQIGMNYLRQHKFVQVGDAIIIVSAWHQGSGFTNCIRVVYASPGLIPNNQNVDFEELW